jgi:hypothetical protein
MWVIYDQSWLIQTTTTIVSIIVHYSVLSLSVKDRLDTFDGGQGYMNIMQNSPLQTSKMLEHSLNHPKTLREKEDEGPKWYL